MTEHLPVLPTNIPLPPDAVLVFGYRGNARFVSFRWAYDDLLYDDGVNSGTANGWGFSAFSRHRAVWPLLSLLTPKEGETGRFTLLIDIERNVAGIAPPQEAKAFLREQWPPVPPMTEDQVAELRRRAEELIAQGWQEVEVDPAEVRQRMAEQRGRVARFFGWLDLAPDAGPDGRIR